MIIQEQWVRWEPLIGLSTNYNIVSLSDKIEGFEILLSDEADDNKKIRIFFENSVEAYRSSDETYRLKTFEELDEKYGAKFYAKWSFFRVLNSQYLTWLADQSCGISESRALKHFSFFTTNSIVDVVASYEPKIELIENK